MFAARPSGAAHLRAGISIYPEWTTRIIGYVGHVIVERFLQITHVLLLGAAGIVLIAHETQAAWGVVALAPSSATQKDPKVFAKPVVTVSSVMQDKVNWSFGWVGCPA
jgi:hypothetical protein